MQRDRILSPRRVVPLIFLILGATSARAGDFRFGAGLGYGGAGITKAEAVGTSDAKQSVKRSEGPGTISLYVDYVLGDRATLGFEHLRGYRLGPFSSGVGFTGINTRWYFRNPVPTVGKSTDGGSTLLVQQYSFFVGLGSGVAVGTINRDDDKVPSIQSSGVYIGINFGADYPLAPGIVLRPQITSYSTFSSSSKTSPADLSFFSFGASVYFFL
jgi:hypothetical protein